jgi:hypothetical protein
MSFGADIVTLLKTDATLVATLTGGIHEYSDTGRKGLTRLLTADAYTEATGLLKPTALVLEMDDMPDGEIVGLSTSFVTPIAIMIYDNGNTDVKYANIITAHDRIYHLLHLASISNAAQVLYDKTIKFKREPNLKDAAYFRAMYRVHAYRTV